MLSILPRDEALPFSPAPGRSPDNSGRAWCYQHHTRPDPHHWRDQCHRLIIRLSCPRRPREPPASPPTSKPGIPGTAPSMVPGRRRTGAGPWTGASKSSSASATSSGSSCWLPTIYFERRRNPPLMRGAAISAPLIPAKTALPSGGADWLREGAKTAHLKASCLPGRRFGSSNGVSEEPVD